MYPVLKFLSPLVEPANFLAALTLLAVLLRRSDIPSLRTLSHRLFVLVGLLVALAALLPVGAWSLRPLENRFGNVQMPERIDGIILLTGDENLGVSESRNFPVAGRAAQRYIHFARLAHRYPQARLVISGNTQSVNPAEKVTTKMIASAVLRSVAIDPNRVLFEEESRNTRENALMTLKAVAPKAGENWVVVTSGYHMPRAVMTFAKLGWIVTPSVADYYSEAKFRLALRPHLAHNIDLVTLAAHEYIGLVSYWLFGWIDRPW